MFGDLKGKVAIVTGSGLGIGRGIACRLSAEGCKVVVNGLPSDPLTELVAELRSRGGQAIGVVADVGLREQAEHLVQAAVSEFEGVDILVNNAGWSVPVAHLLDMSD